MKPRVLISDSLPEVGLQIFYDRGIEIDSKPELSQDKAALREAIPAYEGLVVRSATKVTEKLLSNAERLRVVGRAGMSVDNIDIRAASAKGVIVMNTPYGNSIAAAEHTIAMMMSLARQIPGASVSTHAGRWEKKRFMGVELTSKTLGVIGVGSVGSIVCARALGLRMNILAYDPFLSAERAGELGVEKVTLDRVLTKADFISLHTPVTDKTRNILSAGAIAKMKPGVRIINCARGGLIDELALAKALKAGHVAGAALDVFAQEPALENPLFNMENVILTPHLSAATYEARENVAVQIAVQMSDYLLGGEVQNALNMPSVTAGETKRMRPWLKLAGHLGYFIGQMTKEPIKAINILYDGAVAGSNLEALDCSAIAGIMRVSNPEVNMVSAPIMVRARGIKTSRTIQKKSGVFDAYIKLTVVSSERERSIAGTVFSDQKPRFIQIMGINIDAGIGANMLYTTNRDVPGVIGTLGRILAEGGINIANFTLGRSEAGGDAIALLYLDQKATDEDLVKLRASGVFHSVNPLEFVL